MKNYKNIVCECNGISVQILNSEGTYDLREFRLHGEYIVEKFRDGSTRQICEGMEGEGHTLTATDSTFLSIMRYNLRKWSKYTRDYENGRI